MVNKYEYLHVLQGRYGQGWEDLCAGTWREMRDDCKAYRNNEGGAYRIIQRRELATHYCPVCEQSDILAADYADDCCVACAQTLAEKELCPLPW